jgi:hypothetical protein
MEGLPVVPPVAAIVVAAIHFVALVKILNKRLYRGRRSLLPTAVIVDVVVFRLVAVADWQTLPGSGWQ